MVVPGNQTARRGAAPAPPSCITAQVDAQRANTRIARACHARMRATGAQQCVEAIAMTATTVGGLHVVSDYSNLDETGLVGEDDRLDAVAEVEFLEDAGDVGFDGPVANDEFGGDLRVGQATCD